MRLREPKKWDQLYEASLKFLYPLTPTKTYRVIVEEAMKLVGAKYGSIFLEEEGKLKRMYASHKLLFKVEPRETGMTQHAFETGETHIRSGNELKKYHEVYDTVIIGSDILQPLKYNKYTIGVLSAMSGEKKGFTKEDVEILNLFSPMAMIAIRKALLYKALKKAISARDLFISLAAHELKTPLTTVYLRTQALAQKVKAGEMPKIEDVEKLLGEEVRLNKLINDFLEVDKIKTGTLQVELKKCNIKKIVERAVRNFEDMFPEHRVELVDEIRTDKDGLIEGDGDKLLEAVGNVLNNAGKYSKIGTRVGVKLVKIGKRIRVTVTDEGVGIPKNELSKISEQYYKVDRQQKSGMGLGLYLVEEIMKRHGGEVRIESEVGKGTKVSLIWG